MFTRLRTRNNQIKWRVLKLCIRKKQFLLKKLWNRWYRQPRVNRSLPSLEIFGTSKIILPFRFSWQISSYLWEKGGHKWSPVVLSSFVLLWVSDPFLETYKVSSSSLLFPKILSSLLTSLENPWHIDAGSKTLFHLGHCPEPCYDYWIQGESANR